MKTYFAKKGEIQPNWYVVDATDKTIGRIATEVSKVLRGKHRPTFTPNQDTGDYVVVINSEKVRMSGNKWTQKSYYHHTGYFGGIKEIRADKLLEKDAKQIIESAVSGMMPKTKLGRKQLKKLKAYNGAEHPHTAQKVEALNL
ncbi:MAG: 50S ribosomal protein L13 [Bdellovibrionota bacterium]|nr:50S ribosomal protein L13 [Pseudobdellovibrionaceae bacterium]MEC9281896.1 50S ribosomal protein L13 [Bdellovibrionota bacterium]|tara:strand:+ start:20352 stop:20780 length:429 start_codon:yes stop_codon:yes gene_type:complete